MVDGGGLVLGEMQFVLQIQGEDGLHPIVGESLTELISHNEENTEGIAQLKHHKSNCMKNVVEI